MTERPLHRQSRFIVALAVVAAVSLLVGIGVGWLVPKLASPGDNSAEAGFARDMTTHHTQAIDMGLTVYRNSTNADIRQLGVDIATTQQGDIGTMQTWLRIWGLSPTGTRPAMAWMPEGTAALENGLMPGMATGAQMGKLHQATGTELDIVFCQLMLRHHLGGIHMAEGVLEQSSNKEVRAVAETMKAGQTKELNVLRNLLEDLGAKPL